MNERRLPVGLGCGAVVADLLEQVSEGHAEELTAHQIGCLYCRPTLSRLADSWRAVERLRVERVLPSPRLLEGVMRRIRAGLDDWQVELGGKQGTTRISLAVLISLTFWAASAAPGVRQVFSVRPIGSDVQEAGRSRVRRQRQLSRDNLRIELELSIHYGFSAVVVAEEVRRAVIDQVRETAGLELVGVELMIADVS